MTFQDRLNLIVEHREFFEPYTGPFTLADLLETYDRELSEPALLLPRKVVHIISGNTPHAAYQTLLNGLLVGAHNYLKLPSQSLLDFQIPAPLRPFVTLSRDLPDHWIPDCDALVVYGSDATLRHFQQLCPLETPFIAHGHRVGIAVIHDPSPEAATLAARDIGEFNQNGCLSLQTIFLKNPKAFGPLLAEAMAAYEKQHPRGPLDPSQAGAITNLREEHRFLAAQNPEKYTLWESPASTAWTILHEESPTLKYSPGNRTVYLRPLPESLDHLTNISGIGLHPFDPEAHYRFPRIFPLGQAQSPPALWPHDGITPLRSLTKHRHKF